MTLVVSPTWDDLFAKLGTFLVSVLPAGVEVVQLPTNRTPAELPVPGYVGMRPGLIQRLMTNLDRWDGAAVAPTTISIEQAVKATIQLDCYGPDSGNWAVILSTVFRDEYAVEALAPVLAPLYADDPKFGPLVAGEEQYEHRWIVGVVLQYNPVVTVPAQFANAAEVALINVDEAYPP